MQRNKRNGSRKKMMVRRSIKKSLRRKIMGASAKHGLDLYREIKEMKQKNEMGLTKYRFGQYEEKKEIWADKIMEFEQSMDLASINI